MDSDDLIGLIRETVREEMAGSSFAIGTIDTIDGTSASVRFDGETAASTKKYPSVGYSPVAGDRVVLSLVGRSWVILGKIGSAGGSGGGDHPDSDHEDAFSPLGHTHDTSHNHDTEYSLLGHGHTVDDTGWLAPTFLNGWSSHSSSHEVQYRRRGDWVHIRGLGVSGTAEEVFNLPSGYRPHKDLWFGTSASSGAERMAVRSSGDVQAYGYSGSSWHSVACSFITDDAWPT